MIQYDVLGIGCAAVDDFLFVDGYPPPDVKARIRRSDRQCGGMTATALVAAARFGASTAYAGRLGDNDLSHFVEQTLNDAGVDTSHVPRRSGACPLHSTIVVDTARHTRNIFYEIIGDTGADDELPAVDVIRSSRVLLVDHYGMAGNLRAMAIARDAGIPVVSDFERRNVDHFDEAFAMIDHLVLSARFAAELTQCATEEECVRRLLENGHGVVVVTAGARGCWYGTSGGVITHQPAFPVTVVDTTGCGDVFHGVYCAALAEGRPLDEIIRLASAAAAIKATAEGGQRGIPDRATVEALAREAADRLI